MPKTHDLVIKTGSYTNREGQEKGRYKNVGSIITKEDGSRFMLLDRTFNPAGVPNPDNRDTVLISMYKVEDKEDGASRQQSDPAPQKMGGGKVKFEDDIPFMSS